MKEGTLMSSHGSIHFNADTGRVLRCRLGRDFGKRRPVKIDVEEWKRRYPAEHHLLAEQHDILDFGMWFRDESYEGPCEDWRKEREEMLREEREDMLREEADERDREKVNAAKTPAPIVPDSVEHREGAVCDHLASMGL